MKFPLKPIDPSGIASCLITERQSKVNVSDFAKPWEKGGESDSFIDRLQGLAESAARDCEALNFDGFVKNQAMAT